MNEDITLKEAKQWLRDRLDDGAHCPLCTQWAKIYRWSMYATAVRGLALTEKIGLNMEDGWVHSNDLKSAGNKGQGDITRLRYWGLAEHDPERRSDKGKSGWRRVTPRGRSFLKDEISIPRYIWVYDDRVLRRSSEQKTLTEVLKEPFSYSDVVLGEDSTGDLRG